MLPVARVSQYALYSYPDIDQSGLQRLAHTLRLEGDYVGAQAIERELVGRLADFIEPGPRSWSSLAALNVLSSELEVLDGGR